MKHTLWAVLGVILFAGCKDDSRTDVVTVVDDSAKLQLRAYVVSAVSSEMTVFDLSDPVNASILGVVPTASNPHMAETSADSKKVYASGPTANAVSIFDARTLKLIKTQPVGLFPTHMTASPDNKYIAVNCEDSGEAYFISVANDSVAAVVPGFLTPHWVAFRPDSKYAYVANKSGYRITILDMATFAVVGHIFLTGHSDPSEATATVEGGFAECFSDSMGVLYSAHAESGKVMTVNTMTNVKMNEITVGTKPWVAYVSPFGGEKILVANQGSATISLIDGNSQTVLTTIGSGGLPVIDPQTGNTVRTTSSEGEVFGINYAYMGQKAYAGFRTNGAVQKINLLTNAAEDVYSLTEGLPAKGFTQPASTTADQRYLVFCITSTSDWQDSGANGPVNRVVVWDSVTDKPVKIFDNVGIFPWSSTIPHGDNYCH